MTSVTDIQDLLVCKKLWFDNGHCTIEQVAKNRFRLICKSNAMTTYMLRRTAKRRLSDSVRFRRFRCGLDRTFCFDTMVEKTVLLSRLRERLTDRRYRWFSRMTNTDVIRHEIERRRWLAWTHGQLVAGVKSVKYAHATLVSKRTKSLSSALSETRAALDLTIQDNSVRIDIVVKPLVGGFATPSTKYSSMVNADKVKQCIEQVVRKQIKLWKPRHGIGYFENKNINWSKNDLTIRFTGSIRSVDVYPTDIDIQMFCKVGHVSNTKKWSIKLPYVRQNIQRFVRLLQTVVAYENPAVTLMTIECGFDPRYVQSMVNDSSVSVRSQTLQKQAFQQKAMLLWSKHEIRSGRKAMPNGAYVLLSKALIDRLPTVKFIVRVGPGQYIDVDQSFILYASTNDKKVRFINRKTLYSPGEMMIKWCLRHRFYKVLKTIRTMCGLERNKTTVSRQRKTWQLFYKLINFVATTTIGLLHHLRHQSSMMINLIGHAGLPPDFGVFRQRFVQVVNQLPTGLIDISGLAQGTMTRYAAVSVLTIIKTTLDVHVNHACYPLIDIVSQQIMECLTFDKQPLQLLMKYVISSYKEYCETHPITEQNRKLTVALHADFIQQYKKHTIHDRCGRNAVLQTPSGSGDNGFEEITGGTGTVLCGTTSHDTKLFRPSDGSEPNGMWNG